MKLKRFNFLTTQVHKEIASLVSVFRYFDGQWFHENGSKIEDLLVSQRLDKCRVHGKFWRAGKSRNALFWAPSVSSVFEIAFQKSPKAPTLSAFAANVLKIVEAINAKFDSLHDELTLVLNRRAFEQLLAEKLNENRAPKSSSVASSSEQASEIYLLAIDVDRFKQINDSYGHDYGDAVLRALAWRLEDYCEQLSVSNRKIDNIVVARPGGEEFSVVITGRAGRADIESLADELRKRIDSSILPGDDQLRVFDRDGLKPAVIPKHQDRHIAISIGVASVPYVSANEAIQRSISRVKHQADVALYSAKGGGRNCVRFFSDILNKYGKIIEYHTDTNVVVIDIGAYVGVRKGQEFKVFHPDFTGDKSYFQNDGRSQRQLGRFPRHSSGTIAAFDIQDEISFCQVRTSVIPGVPFKSASALEAIPLGSISHLISKDVGMQAADLAVASEIEQKIEAESDFSACCVELRDLEFLAKDFGVEFVNSTLAKLHAIISSCVPRATVIGQIEAGRFAFLISEMDADGIKDLCDKIIEHARLELFEFGRVFGGAHSVSFDEEPTPDSQITSNVNPERAIDCAVLACASRRDPFTWAWFGNDAMRELLSNYRSDKLYDRATADGKTILELGVKNGEIFNQIGLSYFENPVDQTETSLGYFSQAVELAKEVPIFTYNLGLALFFLGRNIEAATEMEKFGNPLETQEFPRAYLAVYARALFFVKAAGKDSPVDIAALLDAASLVPEDKRIWGSNDDIEEMRNILQQM